MTGSLPISTVALPPEVRADGAEGRKLYETALGFEQVLVRRLAAELVRSAGEEGSEDTGGDAASAVQRELIPDALAEGLVGQGGFGLAQELYRSLRPHDTTTAKEPS